MHGSGRGVQDDRGSRATQPDTLLPFPPYTPKFVTVSPYRANSGISPYSAISAGACCGPASGRSSIRITSVAAVVSRTAAAANT